jgi:hypothetical protein
LHLFSSSVYHRYKVTVIGKDQISTIESDGTFDCKGQIYSDTSPYYPVIMAFYATRALRSHAAHN